jgi:hypothetical protein
LPQHEPGAILDAVEPPRFPQEFPAEAVSLRRDYGPDERLSVDEPDAVLAGDELHLFGLEDGWRRLTLAEVRGVRSRTSVIRSPWRLVAAMLVVVALAAVLWLVPLTNLARMFVGVGMVLVSLLVLYLRRDADRVRHRLEVVPALGGRLVVELPESVPGRAVDLFVGLVRRRLAEAET